MLGRSGGEGVTLDSLWIIRGEESVNLTSLSNGNVKP